jgi:hypothetical protein
MPRQSNTATTNPDVDTPEVVSGPEGTESAAPKEKKPARGALPEGYVTPVGLAHELGKRGLQKDRDGNVLTEVKPQMVYSYMRNAPKEDAFPIEKVNDDQGNERQALKLDAGIEWWERKNKRAAERKENAAAKAAKKAEKAAATSEAEGSDETGPTEEAE